MTAIDDAAAERASMYPDEGYALVRVRYDRPPGTALSLVGTYDSLDEIEPPLETRWHGYVVYDSEGTAYTAGDLW